MQPSVWFGWVVVVALVGGAFGAGCGSLPERAAARGGAPADAGAESTPEVSVTPLDGVGNAELSLRIQLLGATGELGRWRLFEGVPSLHQQKRVRAGEAPSTLLETLVPSVNFREGGSVVIAPSVGLQPEREYSVLGDEVGLVARFLTTAERRPALARLWPPAEEVSSAQVLVFCAESTWRGGSGSAQDAQPSEAPGGGFIGATTQLQPTGHPARISAGVLGVPELGECVQLTASAPLERGQLVLPPAMVDGVRLEPGPVSHAPSAATEARRCDPGELAWGPGCAQVQDDRVWVKAHGATALWVISNAAGHQVAVVRADGGWMVPGFAPDREQPVQVAVLDTSGRLQRVEVNVSTGPARPHLVVNEVLADAWGPEPQQEWVELYNDGSTAVDLAGFALVDGGASTALPSQRVLPGQYAVVVNDDYDASGLGDVPIAAGALLVRVPRLGKQGLSNGGELVQLVDAAGEVVSRLGPLPKPRPGTSLARRRPSEPDGAPDQVGLHAEPGASPGAANQLGDELRSR